MNFEHKQEAAFKELRTKMSSGSDTDDDIQMKQFLEAADTTLLNNSMFQQKELKVKEDRIGASTENDTVDINIDLPKSQRYIEEDISNSNTDFNLPESMQKHLAKKFCEILKEHYEFYDVTNDNSPKIKIKHKNRVKLLKGNDCYVNSYEDFEFDTKGPEKKPVIKRRTVDDSTDHNINEDSLRLVTVDGNYILSGQEVKNWAKKKERKDKVFHYKMASDGVLHAKEEINEFTEIRRKNKWNENKIKSFKMI